MKCVIYWTEASAGSSEKFIEQAKPITDEEYNQLITSSKGELFNFIRTKFHGNPMEIVTPTVQDYKTEEKRTAFLSNFPLYHFK